MHFNFTGGDHEEGGIRCGCCSAFLGDRLENVKIEATGDKAAGMTVSGGSVNVQGGPLLVGSGAESVTITKFDGSIFHQCTSLPLLEEAIEGVREIIKELAA